MVKNKQKSTAFFLALFVFSLVVGFLPAPAISPTALAQDATLADAEVSYKKIKWLGAASSACLDDDLINLSGGNIENFKDIFQTEAWIGTRRLSSYDAQLAPVGFTLDSEDAVKPCSVALKESLKILGKKGDSDSDVAKALVGTADFVGGGVSRSQLRSRVSSLKSEMASKMTSLKSSISSEHYKFLEQKDFFGVKNLIVGCFDITTDKLRGISDVDFTATIEGGKKVNLYRRDHDDLLDQAYGGNGWLKDTGGINAETVVGDVRVGDVGKGGEAVGLGKLDTWNDRHFPQGIVDSSGSWNKTIGFRSCKYIKDNQGDLFDENVILKDGKLLLSPDKIVGPQNNAVWEVANQKKQAQLQSMFDSEPEKLLACVEDTLKKYEGSTGLGGASKKQVAEYFAAWLANYGTPIADTATVPWTDEEGDQILACLSKEENFGQPLLDIVELTPDKLQELGALNADKDDAAEDAQNCKGGIGTIDAALGFFICPLVDMIFGVIHFIETNLIIPYLAVNPLKADNNAIFNIWTGIRNISYVFLILAFLFLIFSETTSFGGEAYQIKRLAPRLLVVAIGMTLSYYLVGWAIDFFNVLGVGIAQLTKWGIAQTGEGSLVTIEGGALGAGVAGLLASTGAVGLGLFLFKGVGAPTLGVVALVGVLILMAVAVTIVLRQILIIALVIVSPLAIASALLPNTEKLFRTWWSYLSKALMMYPLIIGLFAAGKIGGALLASSAVAGAGAGDTAIKSIMSFVAGIVPLVLVPSTFKLAGGALAGVYGAMRGGIGKAYNGMMGDARDPNSIRGRRNLGMRLNRDRGGSKLATKIAGKNAGKNPKGRRAKLGAKVDRYGGFGRRLADAYKEREKTTQNFLEQDNGNMLIHGLDPYSEHVGGDGNGAFKYGDDEWAVMKAAGMKSGTDDERAARAAHIDSMTDDQKAAFLNLSPEESVALGSEYAAVRLAQKIPPNRRRQEAVAFYEGAGMDQRKMAMRMFAHKSAGSPQGEAQAASMISGMVRDGVISRDEADELGTEFATAVDSGGSMVIKHLSEATDDQGRKGSWWESAANHKEGLNGVISDVVASAASDDIQSVGHKVAQKIAQKDPKNVGESDVDYMTRYMHAVGLTNEDGSGTGKRLEELHPEVQRHIAGFTENALVNKHYMTGLGLDARNKLFGGKGFDGGALMEAPIGGTMDDVKTTYTDDGEKIQTPYTRQRVLQDLFPERVRTNATETDPDLPPDQINPEEDGGG